MLHAQIGATDAELWHDEDCIKIIEREGKSTPDLGLLLRRRIQIRIAARKLRMAGVEVAGVGLGPHRRGTRGRRVAGLGADDEGATRR